jgi:hypothetical protein
MKKIKKKGYAPEEIIYIDCAKFNLKKDFICWNGFEIKLSNWRSLRDHQLLKIKEKFLEHISLFVFRFQNTLIHYITIITKKMNEKEKVRGMILKKKIKKKSGKEEIDGKMQDPSELKKDEVVKTIKKGHEKVISNNDNSQSNILLKKREFPGGTDTARKELGQASNKPKESHREDKPGKS